MLVKDINAYWQQLSAAEIAAGKHRAMVGGLWDEIGLLQFEFMKQQGLRPEHALLDVGCGSLRGGLHFVDYLQPQRYCGLDVNASLIEAGRFELERAGLAHKQPQLLVDPHFAFSNFGLQFDFAIAVSVFTHLFMNHISRCLVELRTALKPDGRFYATFFQAPVSNHLQPIFHAGGKKTSYCDADPFHYAFADFEMLAKTAGLKVELLGDWKHPRSQQMLCFSHR